jgi:hypothetical protein
MHDMPAQPARIPGMVSEAHDAALGGQPPAFRLQQLAQPPGAMP